MINYIRHDEEYYFLVKLVSGEQIVGKGFAVEDEGKTQLFISDPVEIEIVTKNLGKNSVKGVGMNKWIQFSEEDFFIVNEKDIITVAGLSQEMIVMYEMFLKKSSPDKDVKDEEKEVKLDSDMGLLSKVSEARKLLERIFKES